MPKKLPANPVISVVIPAYNEEKFLPACLEHVMKQTLMEPYEVIVANNNSTDHTAAIAKKFGAKVILVKDKGYVFAVKAGVEAAKGQFIAITDADTRVPRHWLAKILEAFRSPEAPVAVGGTFRYYDAPKLQKVISAINEVNPRLAMTSLSGMNMAFTKVAYQAVGGYDTTIDLQADAYIGEKLLKYGQVTYLKDNEVVASGRRVRASGKTIIEGLVRFVNALAIKLFNTTIFKKQTDYR